MSLRTEETTVRTRKALNDLQYSPNRKCLNGSGLSPRKLSSNLNNRKVKI
jgi:hypothetical protein